MSTTVSSKEKSKPRRPRSRAAKGASGIISDRLSAMAVAGQGGFWSSAAPKHLAIDLDPDWQRWFRHLHKRKSPRPLDRLAQPGGPKSAKKRNKKPSVPKAPTTALAATPLAWGIDRLSTNTANLLAIVDALAQNRTRNRKSKSACKQSAHLLDSQAWDQTLCQWLETHEDLENNREPSHQNASCPAGSISQVHWPETQDALSCLAIAHALPSLAEIIPAQRWWQLLDRLGQIVALSAGRLSDCELPLDQSLAQQLLAGELPFTLAYQFPEIKPLASLHASARDSMSAGMQELLNGEGLPHGLQLPILRPLLASWTRCLLISQAMKRRCWSRKAHNQYLWLVRQALRCSAPDGRPLLSNRSCRDRLLHPTNTPPDRELHRAAPEEKWSADFLRNVLSLGGDDSDLTAARGLFDKNTVALLDKPSKTSWPATSDHCQWAGLAVMRTAWSRKAPTVAVDFSTSEFKIEIVTAGHPLAAGVWSDATSLDGQRLKQTAPWEEVCWFSDEDVDYLELSMEMTGGARLERKILLAREDLFLLLADSVLTTADKKSSNRKGPRDSSGHRLPAKQRGLMHTSRLPLDAAIQWLPAEKTREGLLATNPARAPQPLARVLPLALPEWRSDRRVGELTCESSSDSPSLQWTCHTLGRCLTSPIFIDLKSRRTTRQCTWRQLTVAQALEIQPAEVAAGYRVQCAKKQWLIYQSLAPRANRTLLGHNLSSEYLVGRFLAPAGEVDELLEIEG